MGIVVGAVIETEEREVFGPIFDFLKPFEHDFANGGLLIEDGQNNGKIGLH
jgi:hypothetical protein